MIVKILLGLSPVLLLLAVFVYLDSWKLVDLSRVLQMLVIGGLLAVASRLINGAALGLTHLDLATYGRYVAPCIEESLKAGVLVYLFMRNRIGFMVDAAIIGFTIGAGFGVVENLFTLQGFPQASLGVWLARGFGTAVMHGGATALFGVLAQYLTDRHARFNPALYLPGLAIAVVAHGVFNGLADFPIVATACALLVLLPTLLLVFAKSEHKIHQWLLTDYESHEHLLEDIQSGKFQHEEGGRFILDLARHFDESVVADAFAYVRLHTELVLRFDRLEMARESGETVPFVAEDWQRSFKELHGLERKIGKTALMSIRPHLHFSRKELWELYEIEHQAQHRHHHPHVAAGKDSRA
ncbi:MAG: PrsW family glutamic-type intramembrane protease [Steroidobacteraceae bacterium]